MPTLAVGNKQRGFTLLELLVVVSIMALATAGVGLALRDTGTAQLEREAERLAALLESGRAQSRASGVPVRWQAVADGFRFDGAGRMAGAEAPTEWLHADTSVRGPDTLILGPEPLIGPQHITLVQRSQPESALRVATDGLRPFSVQATP
ncbi:MAG: prepilin-type N-terminal cleavage/methylation domain-containing protein [Burkholderiaceae bacterium]|nr:prepilin-type N-terminal cleavage/methylation domain-containing protein [Burkholderiaceae bacterium]